MQIEPASDQYRKPPISSALDFLATSRLVRTNPQRGIFRVADDPASDTVVSSACEALVDRRRSFLDIAITNC
jgi:hypothetical protein